MDNEHSYEKYLQKKAESELRARFDSAYKWLGLAWSDEALKGKTFENFDVSRQQKARKIIDVFLNEMHGTLVLYGGFGTGKTHLLAALCNQLIRSGQSPRFTTSPNLFAAIQDRVSNGKSYTDLIFAASTASLLVLDDVDKAKWSDFREETYFVILDARVKRDLPTALSTNRLSELANFVGGAVASRLSISRLAAEMVGSDFRPSVGGR